MATRQSVRQLVLIIVACLLMAACGAPDFAPAGNTATAPPEAATPVELIPAAPTEPGTSDDSYPDGFVLTMQADVDTTVRPEVIARSHDLLVVGRVVEELPAFWTTPDGRRPAVIGNNLPYPDAIVTPYVIELEVPDYLQPLTGPIIPLSENGLVALSGDSNRIVVIAVGGTVGKDSIVNRSNSGLLTLGEQVLAELVMTRNRKPGAPTEPLVLTAAGPGWWCTNRFVLDADGTATIYDKTMSATQLVRSILDARSPELPGTPVP